MGAVTGGNVPSVAGFRDKIAKFERKGGVPVPRGRFGLGAPPTSEGPRKQGELYGNRIPAPARHVSAGVMPSVPSSGLSTAANSPSTSPVTSERRSFSLSSALSDFSDDQPDYTPISSPTFAFPLESPESLASIGFSPDGSPSISPSSDVAAFHRPIVRGTSFQKALEIARNAETAKLEAQVTGGPTPHFYAHEMDKERELEPMDLKTAIVASSQDIIPEALHSSPIVQTQELPIVAEDGPASIFPVPSAPEISFESLDGLPPTGILAEEDQQAKTPFIETSPMSNQSRALPHPPSEIENIICKATEDSEAASGTIETKSDVPTHLDSVAPQLPTVIVHAPSSPEVTQTEIAAENSELFFDDLTEVDQIEVSMPVIPHPSEPLPEASEIMVQPDTRTRSLPEFVPPQIIVHHDCIPLSVTAPVKQVPDDLSTNAKIASRKTFLTLDSDLLEQDSLMSPLSSGDISATTLADALTNYFTPGAEPGDRMPRATTPPPLPPPSPLSPMATLAYDAPDSSTDLIFDIPDPSSLLSPPISGVAPLSGHSSLSSTGSRPMSMMEISPSHVSRAMRMTPATSRGVPLFLPPNSAHTRKSDFVYFPPTPEAAETDFGSATLHKSSQSLSLGSSSNRRGSEQPLVDPLTRPATFTAVVHGKVREAAAPPAERKRYVPETPQMKKVKRMTIMEPPMSPGQGELAALLAEAALLEDTLDRGELPSEFSIQMAQEEKRRKEQDALNAANVNAARKKEEERKMAAEATAQAQAKREESTSGRLKHTFLIPLSRARTLKQAPASNMETNYAHEDPIVRPKSAALPEKSSARTAREELSVQTNQALRPTTPENSAIQIAPQTPSKSPKSSRFASFRRLGSISRPNTIHGNSNSARHSQSTSSEFSEDSAPVVTPPEGSLEFGIARTSPIDEFGHMTNGSTTSFPSLSPKKSINSIGRATSFAEKMWSRARTRSGSSNLSAASEIPDDTPSLPSSVVHLPAIQLPHLPNIPVTAVPSSERDANVVRPPQRSTSLRHPMYLPPLPTEKLPPLPVISSSAFFPTTTGASDSLMLPGSSDSTRPSSWTSMSSAGSLPSPLFDESFFDAFPSVPDTSSAVATAVHHNLSRNPSILAAVSERPSFDSELLSSAIHLASTHKSITPSVPATNPDSKRTSTPTLVPHRSGELRR